MTSADSEVQADDTRGLRRVLVGVSIYLLALALIAGFLAMYATESPDSSSSLSFTVSSMPVTLAAVGCALGAVAAFGWFLFLSVKSRRR